MYARDTAVPVERSRAEIERLLRSHKCSQFVVGSDDEHYTAMIQFKASNRVVRFTLAMPNPADKKYQRDGRGSQRSMQQRLKAVAQDERQRWRALLLVLKAKLESIESGISTFESEFLAHIVLPNDRTVGDMVTPVIERAYATGAMPRLLTEGEPVN